jgi:hypothetical protein
MDLIGRNADFDACAREKAIFEADEKIYNAFTAREAAHPSTNCIYGNGICDGPGSLDSFRGGIS